MIILYIVLIIWSIVNVYLTVRARQQEAQTIQALEDKYRRQLIDKTVDLQSVYDVLNNKYISVQESYEKETQRLEEIKKLAADQEVVLDQSYTRKKALLEQKFASDFEQEKQIYQMNVAKFKEELEANQEELLKFSAMMESVNQAILRAKEIEEQESFYSINISENDQADIKRLEALSFELHNREVIPKLIWEVFVRRPTQEMIKRVIAGKDISGIYKITNKKTHEAYIGKSTNIATRWQNHIKTAIGMGAAAQSTLHTRLAADGIWNYTFEVIETVDKNQLSERESYYIDLFQTKQQLNMKAGEKHGTE